MAVLAELRGIDGDKLEGYADWVAAHAETHLPFVAEIDGFVVGAAWLLVAERVPGNGSLDRRYGDIQSVMVREEYRNRGTHERPPYVGDQRRGHAGEHQIGSVSCIRRTRFAARLGA